MTHLVSTEEIHQKLDRALLYHSAGKITKSLGLLYEAHLPGAGVGSICRIYTSPELQREEWTLAEVVGFREKRVLLMPLEEVKGINSDSLVVLHERQASVPIHEGMLGRVIDGLGRPIDGKGPIESPTQQDYRSLYASPSHPLDRERVTQALDLGVRSLNGLLTCGKGQRVGIFAGSGVGKSVLLGMCARYTSAEVNIIALIGERGREVREFIENDLGEEGLKKSIIIVATSDKPSLFRVRAASMACTLAEYFRDQGKDVLLMMDSLTRFSMAQREMGLSMGEPPASKGYTPSVFSALPKLLERAGMGSSGGSITGIYTVLVEGDDMDDPIADAARSILDGHIVLTRKLAHQNHFPAIDVLQSASRVMRAVVDKNQDQWSRQIKEWIALYREAEDLIQIGAYVRGSNPKVDQAISVIDRIQSFLRQDIEDYSSMNDTKALMHSIVRAGEANLHSAKNSPKK